MIKVVGIKFKCSTKMYYFDPEGEEYKRGELVIVETARGNEMGAIVVEAREVPEDEVVQPLKPITRRATEEDVKKSLEYKEKEPEAFKRCKEKIRERGLEMKLVKAEYVFDGSKLIFYFTADGRVDFRELVKDLASMFRTRIELRQIGVRDEAMICGGVGVCGRGLCCQTYLNDFVPVSIKMAKDQNLSLNPTKISGVCGRLMCCLSNEAETYKELNASLPRVGDEVIDKFEGTKGKVTDVNVLSAKIKVVFKKDDESTEIKEFDVSDLRFTPGKRQVEEDDFIDDEELSALLRSEEKDKELKEEQEGEGREACENSRQEKHKKGYEDRRGNRENRRGNRNNRNNQKNHDIKNESGQAEGSEKKEDKQGDNRHRNFRNKNRNRNNKNNRNNRNNRNNGNTQTPRES